MSICVLQRYDTQVGGEIPYDRVVESFISVLTWLLPSPTSTMYRRGRQVFGVSEGVMIIRVGVAILTFVA